jgi:hypothetical protein
MRVITSTLIMQSLIVINAFFCCQGSRSLKKKRIDILETPKLFSSTFEVPKVKVPSTPA